MGQHGLWLHHCDLESGTRGEVRPWIGSPNFVQEVCVDTNRVIGVSDTLETAAHELGHGVKLTHPGEAVTGIVFDCDSGHFKTTE